MHKPCSTYYTGSIGNTLVHPFNGLFSRTTWVSWYQKGKTSLDLNETRDYWVLGCSGISLTIYKQSAPHSRQINTPTPHHSIFYSPDALHEAQPRVSKHRRHNEGRSTLKQLINKIATGNHKQNKRRFSNFNKRTQVPSSSTAIKHIQEEVTALINGRVGEINIAIIVNVEVIQESQRTAINLNSR